MDSKSLHQQHNTTHSLSPLQVHLAFLLDNLGSVGSLLIFANSLLYVITPVLKSRMDCKDGRQTTLNNDHYGSHHQS